MDLSEFSAQQYRPYLHRQFGRRNPQRMNNPFWEAMVMTREPAYRAVKAACLPDFNRPAVWCFRLNLQSFAIEPVPCDGAMPGWIHDHQACLVDGTVIEITGGKIQTEEGMQPNDKCYRLNVARRNWQVVPKP